MRGQTQGGHGGEFCFPTVCDCITCSTMNYKDAGSCSKFFDLPECSLTGGGGAGPSGDGVWRVYG